jgi:hypothetical protein
MGDVDQAIREPSPDQLKVLELGLKQPLSSIEFTAPQLVGYHFGITHPKFILSMDKGMGKTVLYLAIGLNGEPEYVIVVCPTNAMAAQRREILRHFPFYHDKWIFVRGNQDQRYRQWRRPGCRIFICTMATLQTDIGGRTLNKRAGTSSTSIVPPWVLSSCLDHMSLDEFQKYVRRPKSNSFKQLKKLRPATFIPDSGSPVSTGPHELWPALHLCDPKFWSSYWRYVDTWCETEPGLFGGKEIIGPRNVEGWRNAVAPFVYHRKKDPRDYPAKQRFIIEFDLPDWQRKLHDELRNELWTFTKDGTAITARNSLDALYRARLGLICPKALDASFDYGAGIEGIADDAEDLSHFVLSTPFKAPIPHLEAYLRSRGRKVWVLAGGRGIDPDTQDRIIREFESQGGTVIQTILYATSYEFLVPEHHYFLGYEYDPEANKQAEGRFERLSSTRPINHWYVRFPGTYDEDLIEQLVVKGRNVHRLMDERRYWAEVLK